MTQGMHPVAAWLRLSGQTAWHFLLLLLLLL
jgi:hypothetical protein